MLNTVKHLAFRFGSRPKTRPFVAEFTLERSEGLLRVTKGNVIWAPFLSSLASFCHAERSEASRLSSWSRPKARPFVAVLLRVTKKIHGESEERWKCEEKDSSRKVIDRRRIVL